MKKKILAGLLSAMMVVSLAACGNSETAAGKVLQQLSSMPQGLGQREKGGQVHRL